MVTNIEAQAGAEVRTKDYTGAERRRNRRYILRGRVEFIVDSLPVWGELINFGSGGMLVRSPFELLEGSTVRVRVMAFCYPSSFDVEGRIVGGKDSLVSIQFLDPPEAVVELLRWLEREHFPWTGIAVEGPAPEAALKMSSQRVVASGLAAAQPEELELVYQLA